MSLDLEKLGASYETVIDVGAFQGDFALACLRRWHQARVISFEPLNPEPRKAMRGYRRRWAWYSVALGAQVGRVEMNRNEFIPSSSILPMADLHRDAFPYTRRTEPVEVGVALLDEFYEHIASPALLKIDTQGYELEVLRGGTEVLTLCDAVVCEVSHELLYEGQPRFEEIDGFLVRHGFDHAARIEELRHPERQGMLLQSDELWTRV